MIRFGRERSRVVGSLAMPLVFWLLIGTGIGGSFQPKGFPEGFSYLGFFYPGMLGLTLLFTSIFSTISIIGDREHGFLKEILVSPVSRSSIILGKVAAGATLAVVQGVLLLPLAPFVGLPLTLPGVGLLVLAMVLLSLGLTALGLSLAWHSSSTQGFHMVMNFFLFPMWLLSGAMFPIDGLPAPIRMLVHLNPLTYGVDVMRGILARPGVVSTSFVRFPVALDMAMLAVFTAVLVAVALKACQERR